MVGRGEAAEEAQDGSGWRGLGRRVGWRIFKASSVGNQCLMSFLSLCAAYFDHTYAPRRLIHDVLYAEVCCMFTALEKLDLDGDWDPATYDQQMAVILEETSDDDEKPMWDDDIDIGNIVPLEEDSASMIKKERKEKKKEEKKAKDREKIVATSSDSVDLDEMDVDVEQPEMDDEEWDETEEMRK